MKHLCRVVWSEGMHLGPHHFQVQSRYFEDSIRFAAAALSFESYGFIGCGLDAEALSNGTVSLLHARGVFPDGLLFHMPECDPAPAARNIAELFPPTRNKVTVLLGVPEHRLNGMNCAVNGGGGLTQTRFTAASRLIYDETSGRDEKPVQLGRKNFSLLLDTEVADSTLQMPLARIMRDGSGHFVFDPSFIPPCIHIGASTRVMEMLKRIIELLEEKSTALTAGSNAGGRSWTEYSSRDIAQFWLLHTVNSALAPLRQMYAATRIHPEELYVQLLRLGGALCTFAIDLHPRSLPLYEHRHLDQCFEAIDRHIRANLDTVVPTAAASVPLRRVDQYFWHGSVTDQRCLDRSRWILSIRGPVGEVDLIAKTPNLVKVCSKTFVEKLVARALPGLTLTHQPVPPASISAQVDAQYFNLNKAGPCWDHIVQTREVGIYVPGDLPDPDLELLVVLES